MKVTYSEGFFNEMDDSNLASARVVVPRVLDLVPVSSVVDIGCGRGLWLKAFLEAGVKEVHGFDGDYVETDKLAFPKEQFHVADLELPLSLSRSFDLAVCLEVAEHLPHPAADALVESLTRAAPVILFSAAIPLQGGSHHVNEQWPRYWEEKFAARGYVPVDCIRRWVWDDKRVSFFYAQNILVYVKKDALENYPKLRAEIAQGNNKALPLVHPSLYTYYSERWRLMVPLLSIFPPKVLHAAKFLLRTALHMPLAQAVRYLISGATAVGVNIILLYAFVEFLELHYLPASALAFALAILVSFMLHKFFTFREHTITHIPHQAMRYLITIGISLALNTALMWFFVEGLGIPYLLAQALSSGIVAIANFFAYKLFVFRVPHLK